MLDRDGWLAMDAHLHGAPSFDGALPMEDRLATCAATGVDLPVLTDHDVHVDYRDLASAMGLEERLQVIPGVEVTTMMRGHFNVYPLQAADPGLPQGGALQWWEERVSTSDLFELIRQTVGGEPLLQINHPRTPGMLAFAGYSPSSGEPDEPDSFSWDFETFELLNSGVKDLEDVRTDWFSFLDLGQIHTPLGVSDSHYRFIPCGLGRTDVFLDSDDPSKVQLEDLWDALLAGHVVVAAGTTLRVAAGEALPGDTVTGAELSLEVQVLTPGWIEPGTLRLYQDGELIHEELLTERSADGAWFDGSFALQSEQDAWYVVEVWGESPLGAAWRDAAPYAVSNAIFQDVQGDGWAAPGS